MSQRRVFEGVWSMVLALLAAAGSFLFACQSREPEPGVVAVVNGDAITLRQLRSAYDFLLTDREDPVQALERIQDDYGRILAGLIVQTLVRQELDRRGRPVSDSDILSVENEIRADYPEGLFEQTLLEECVDLDEWREGIRTRLEAERFQQEILRPEVRIDPEEIREYYRRYSEDFVLPERVVLVMIRGSDRDETLAGANLAAKYKDIDKAAAELSGLDFQKATFSLGRLVPEWSEAVKDLAEWKPGPVMAERNNFLVLMPTKRIEAGLAPLSQAYAVVERAVVGNRMDRAFNDWLDARLANSSIVVNKTLTVGMGREDRPKNDELQDRNE